LFAHRRRRRRRRFDVSLFFRALPFCAKAARLQQIIVFCNFFPRT
jgi:hypothetical protein